MTMLETLSFLVHSDSKVGKTTLASTSPPPILILDAEGGSKFLRLRKIAWDPMIEAPPVYDGTWEACIVNVRDFNTLTRAGQWLQSGQHHFRSIVVDSITEVQRRSKKNLVGTEAMKMPDWGQLLTVMDDVIRGFRDLMLHPTNPVSVVVFIAETRQSNSGKWRPYMQGQIDIALPYWMDIVGYLYVEQTPDANGQLTIPKRRLLISPNDRFEAGERVQGVLGGNVLEPNITTMYLTVFPHLAAPAATT